MILRRRSARQTYRRGSLADQALRFLARRLSLAPRRIRAHRSGDVIAVYEQPPATVLRRRSGRDRVFAPRALIVAPRRQGAPAVIPRFARSLIR